MRSRKADHYSRGAATRTAAAGCCALIAAVLGTPPTVSAGCDAPQELRFGFSGVVVRSDMETLGTFLDLLEDETGHTFDGTLTRSCREMMERIEEGSVDIAHLCGAPYTMLRDGDRPPEPLVAPQLGDAEGDYSMVLVRADSRYDSLDDLAGQPYAFSDPLSALGSLVPTIHLDEAGIGTDDHFAPLLYIHDHAESARAVEAGLVEGASVGGLALRHLEQAAPELSEQLRIAERFGPYPAAPVIARQDLCAETRESITAALTGLADSADGRALLEDLGHDGFAPVEPEDFEALKAIVDRIRERGLMPNAR